MFFKFNIPFDTIHANHKVDVRFPFLKDADSCTYLCSFDGEIDALGTSKNLLEKHVVCKVSKHSPYWPVPLSLSMTLIVSHLVLFDKTVNILCITILSFFEKAIVELSLYDTLKFFLFKMLFDHFKTICF